MNLVLSQEEEKTGTYPLPHNHLPTHQGVVRQLWLFLNCLSDTGNNGYLVQHSIFNIGGNSLKSKLKTTIRQDKNLQGLL
jgi:hypothetical protein